MAFQVAWGRGERGYPRALTGIVRVRHVGDGLEVRKVDQEQQLVRWLSVADKDGNQIEDSQGFDRRLTLRKPHDYNIARKSGEMHQR